MTIYFLIRLAHEDSFGFNFLGLWLSAFQYNAVEYDNKIYIAVYLQRKHVFKCGLTDSVFVNPTSVIKALEYLKNEIN